jgi:uncharacterized protein YecT (DUF1311 family)
MTYNRVIICGFSLAISLGMILSQRAFAESRLKNLVGEWAVKTELCGKIPTSDNDIPLLIDKGGERFQFSEASCKVLSTDNKSKSEFIVKSECEFEGDPDVVGFRFKLLNNTLILGDDNSKTTYYRCTNNVKSKTSKIKINALTPSYNCKNAKYSDELQICSSKRLSALEAFTADGYKSLSSGIRKNEAKKAAGNLLRKRRQCWLNFESGKVTELDPFCVEKVLLEAIETYHSLGFSEEPPDWLHASNGKQFANELGGPVFKYNYC